MTPLEIIFLARNQLPYKHFYQGWQGEKGEKRDGRRKTGRRTRGRQRIAGQAKRFWMGREPGNALPDPSCAFAGRDLPGGADTPQPAGCRSGMRESRSADQWNARAGTPGGARGSKGSFALQRSLSRWRRMRSTMRGSAYQKQCAKIRYPFSMISLQWLHERDFGQDFARS